MIAATLLMAVQTSAPAIADIRGEWINGKGTAIIQIADCPSGLCGRVIWSAPIAQRDAGRGGTAGLNGTLVMTGFVPSGQRWRGRLFLPDRNRTVKATIAMLNGGQLQVTGCELGGLVCKSQAWNRR